MNIYYELADCIVDEQGKYLAYYDVDIDTRSRFGLMQNSERVWAEDESSVRFLKNRREDLRVAKVDMKEFFWIKLKSQTV